MGHIACRICAYENLLAQKKQIIQQEADIHSAQAKVDQEQKDKDLVVQKQKVKSFELSQKKFDDIETLLVENSKLDNDKSTNKKRQYEAERDREEVVRPRLDENQHKMPSFWLVPSALLLTIAFYDTQYGKDYKSARKEI